VTHRTASTWRQTQSHSSPHHDSTPTSRLPSTGTGTCPLSLAALPARSTIHCALQRGSVIPGGDLDR
jgi:hypothetical protein